MNDLLEAAERVWDGSPALRDAATRAWRRGFASGAEWMAEVRAAVLDTPPDSRAFHTDWRRDNALGLSKNGGAAALAAAGGWAVYRRARLTVGTPAAATLGAVSFVLGFYAIEGQMVFLFPILQEAHEAAAHLSAAALLRACRARTVRAGGTLEVMRTVMPISARMILGGFRGEGFVRSWCLGCIAVVLWHERVVSS